MKYSDYELKTICEARIAAYAAHGAIGQVRKYTGEPYFRHVSNVAFQVNRAGGSVEMVAAAYLHDTIEDTHLTYHNIQQMFGEHVASLVNDLTDFYTDPSYGNRAKRKELERNRLAAISPEAQTIKYADLIDNTSSIVRYDPEFAKVYMAEKKALLEVMTRGDQMLYNQAKAIVENYYD